MDPRMRRKALAALVALAGLLLLPSPTPSPVGAEERGLPYFTEITGGEINQDPGAVPVVGHFTDQVLDDVLWYWPGPAKESLWTPCPDCAETFTKKQLARPLQVVGLYEPIVGDFAGDGLDDIYWLNRRGPDYLWTNTGSGTFSSKRFDMASGDWWHVVLPDSRSGDGKDDILWWQGSEWVLWGDPIPGRLWVFPDDGSGVARTRSRPLIPQGQPLVGDFDGNGAADILFYPHRTNCRCNEPGAAGLPDTLWRRPGSEAPGFTATALDIKGEYVPHVGRFSRTGDGRDDILWVGTETVYTDVRDLPDSLWEGRAGGGFAASRPGIPSQGGSLLLPHDGSDTVIVFDTAGTRVWFNTPEGPVHRLVGNAVPRFVDPLVGRFVDASRADLFFYSAGSGPEKLFHPTS